MDALEAFNAIKTAEVGPHQYSNQQPRPELAAAGWNEAVGLENDDVLHAKRELTGSWGLRQSVRNFPKSHNWAIGWENRQEYR